MSCLKCDGKLVATKVGPLTINRCDLCAGIWFDLRELEQVLAHVRAGGRGPVNDRPVEGDERTGRCPRDEEELVREPLLAFDDLHYEHCARCGGAWLDGGELKKIASDDAASGEISFFTRRP